MWSKRQTGVTLVEMIVAMMIIALGLTGVLSVLTRTSVASADPMIIKQITAIAEAMMEEIQLKPFSSGTSVVRNGCIRTDYDELDDYNGYSQPVCGVNGDAGASGYTVAVTVAQPAASLLPPIPVANARQITVTVSYGANSYSLVGWRTDFGALQK